MKNLRVEKDTWAKVHSLALELKAEIAEKRIELPRVQLLRVMKLVSGVIRLGKENEGV